jgi:SAM-dependent methyltransferase
MTPPSAHEETRAAWEANASVWDARMGDQGNDFFNVLCWPAITRLLQPQPGQHILDVACGNGLTSRHLAALGAQVTAFDFSDNLIELARARTNPKSGAITYRVLDATDENGLLDALLPVAPFDAALGNMALFDITDIEPLFRTLPRLLKAGAAFVFSITHPAFNNASCVRMAEEWDDGGIKTLFSVKVSRYMTPSQSRGVALRNQPEPQFYFDRPLQNYLHAGFQNGFVLDGFEERAFPSGHSPADPLSWGGNFSEIPAVVVARMRKS